MNEQGRSPTPDSTPPPRPVVPAARPAAAKGVSPAAATSPLAKRATTLRLGVTPPSPPAPPAQAHQAKPPSSDPDATVVKKHPSLPADDADDDWTVPAASPPAAQPPPVAPTAAAPPPLPARSTSESLPTAMTKEMRDSIQSAVRVAVEEALAPVKAWQKDVEARIERLSQTSPGRAVYTSPAPEDPFSPIVAASARDHGPAVPLSPAVPVRIDVPVELDGGRRHRNAFWVVAILIAVVLTAFLSAMAVSQATR